MNICLLTSGFLLKNSPLTLFMFMIRLLLENPSYRNSLGHKALIAVQDFDWLKIAASYVNAYEDAIATLSNRA